MTDLSFIDNYKRIRNVFRPNELAVVTVAYSATIPEHKKKKRRYTTKVKQRRMKSEDGFVAKRIKGIARPPKCAVLMNATEAINMSNKYIGAAPLSEEHVAKIISEVCGAMGISTVDATGWRGPQKVTLARKIIYWRARRECYMTYSKIAELFGVQHTTVLYGVNYVEAMASRIIYGHNYS